MIQFIPTSKHVIVTMPQAAQVDIYPDVIPLATYYEGTTKYVYLHLPPGTPFPEQLL